VGERVLLQSARVDGAFGPGTVNRAEIHDRSGGPAGG
jgi:hypothetical protein